MNTAVELPRNVTRGKDGRAYYDRNTYAHSQQRGYAWRLRLLWIGSMPLILPLYLIYQAATAVTVALDAFFNVAIVRPRTALARRWTPLLVYKEHDA